MQSVEVAIIGVGSAGLFALSKLAPQTQDFVVINGGPYGTTCARVGCMPSKVLIQAAEDFHQRHYLATQGILGGEQLRVDLPAVLAHVRKLRDTFVNGVLSASMPRLEGRHIDGYARFVSADTVEVNGERIRAKKFIIATGSRPLIPAAWEPFRDKLLTTDELFEQVSLPPDMAVLGLGVIGLEIGQALARLGVHITGVDALQSIGGLQDPALNRRAVELLGEEFTLWLGAPAQLEAANDKLRIVAGDKSVLVDKALVSVGRVPNLEHLGLENLDLPLDARGRPLYNPNTMQIGATPLFLAGDVNGERQLLHEAGDEGMIAGFNAGREQARGFKRKPPFSLTFTDPNIVSVGARWSELQGRDDVVIGERDFATQARARVLGKNRGLSHLYVRKSDGLLLGAEMLAPRGEHLGHLLAWMIQSQATVFDLLQRPFYHPVVEEGLQNALQHALEQLDNKPADWLELEPLS